MARTQTTQSPEVQSSEVSISTEDMMEALGFGKTEDLSAFKTTSAKIRHLTAQGKSRSEIAKVLGVRYQHVRNVQLQILKKGAAK